MELFEKSREHFNVGGKYTLRYWRFSFLFVVYGLLAVHGHLVFLYIAYVLFILAGWHGAHPFTQCGPAGTWRTFPLAQMYKDRVSIVIEAGSCGQ